MHAQHMPFSLLTSQNDLDSQQAIKTDKKHGKLPDGNADLTQLLRLWGVFGARIKTGCSALRVGDLRCLQGKTDFDTIKAYNQPVLLTLRRDGQKQIVLLYQMIDDDTAVLVGNDDTRKVALDKLLDAWTGQYQMIWRSAANSSLITPGSRGDAVVWLRKILADIESDGDSKEQKKHDKLSPTFDKKLERQLKAFQKSHGLATDGIVGPRTQIMLNAALPSDGMPNLFSAKSHSKHQH